MKLKKLICTEIRLAYVVVVVDDDVVVVAPHP
jgi:hypothetical protein